MKIGINKITSALEIVLFDSLNEENMHAVWCSSSVLNQLLSVFV